jgi:hypothetical protein
MSLPRFLKAESLQPSSPHPLPPIFTKPVLTSTSPVLEEDFSLFRNPDFRADFRDSDFRPDFRNSDLGKTPVQASEQTSEIRS